MTKMLCSAATICRGDRVYTGGAGGADSRHIIQTGTITHGNNNTISRGPRGHALR